VISNHEIFQVLFLILSNIFYFSPGNQHCANCIGALVVPYCFTYSVVCLRVCVSVCLSVCLSACLLATNVNPAKTDEPIDLPFGLWAHWDPKPCIKWGPDSPVERGTFFGGGVIIGHAQICPGRYSQLYSQGGSRDVASGTGAVVTC